MYTCLYLNILRVYTIEFGVITLQFQYKLFSIWLFEQSSWVFYLQNNSTIHTYPLTTHSIFMCHLSSLFNLIWLSNLTKFYANILRKTLIWLYRVFGIVIFFKSHSGENICLSAWNYSVTNCTHHNRSHIISSCKQ